MNAKPLVFLIILGLALLVGMQAAFTVHESEQVVVYQFGDPKRQVTGPGLHFKLPFLQQVRVFESRVLDVDPTPEEVILADQKRLVVDSFARYRITDMVKYQQKLGNEIEGASLLQRFINSSLRSRLGQENLVDVLSEKREGIMEQIRQSVNDNTKEYGIEIVDVRIGRADLPDQTRQSIFKRMRSEREREAAEARAEGNEQAQLIRSKADRERSVLLAEARKRAETIRGEGDQKAIEIYADTYGKDPNFYAFYRTMEAYRNSISNEGTTLVLSPDSDFFSFFRESTGGLDLPGIGKKR